MNLKHIRQLIFGQDIFISHRWTDSSKNYALKLSEELEPDVYRNVLYCISLLQDMNNNLCKSQSSPYSIMEVG